MEKIKVNNSIFTRLRDEGWGYNGKWVQYKYKIIDYTKALKEFNEHPVQKPKKL
jgi:hypothetical protein